jgi:hypothetical protein
MLAITITVGQSGNEKKGAGLQKEEPQKLDKHFLAFG